MADGGDDRPGGTDNGVITDTDVDSSGGADKSAIPESGGGDRPGEADNSATSGGDRPGGAANGVIAGTDAGSSGGAAKSAIPESGGDDRPGGTDNCATSDAGSSSGADNNVIAGTDAGSSGGAAKSVIMVMALSTLARCLSLVGSMRYTAWFGYTLETDIYSYAVNLPNLIFACIGTSLVTVVIPIFAGRVATRDSKKAYRFVDNIVTVSLIFAAFIAVAGILASPLIVRMIDKFRTGDPSLALFALRLMFPVILFHSVSYILQGVLQSNGRFLLPAAVSAFSGLSIILYVAFFAGRFGIRGLLAATFIGLSAQAAVLIFPVVKFLGYRYRPSLNLSDGDVRLAGKLALPVLISSSSYQINMFMNSTFAAGFDGGVVTVTNMHTLAFTAAQLFIISALSVYFPGMSKRYAAGDKSGYVEAFRTLVRMIIIFAVPASAALAYLSRLLIPLLYGHGRVTEADISVSVVIFAVYAGAVASIGFKEAADRAFYAIKDSRTPALASIVIMALNISLSLFFMRKIGVTGLPVAYFIAISTGAVILFLALNDRLKKMNATVEKSGGIAQLAAKCAVSALIMLAALFAVEAALNSGGGLTLDFLFRTAYDLGAARQIFRMALLVAAGGAAYAVSGYMLGVSEIRNLIKRRE